MQIFVSIHLIPPDLKFNPNANPPCFENDEQQRVERGAMVRIKIMGLRMDVKDIVIHHMEMSNGSLLSAPSKRIISGLFDYSILTSMGDVLISFYFLLSAVLVDWSRILLFFALRAFIIVLLYFLLQYLKA